MGDVAYHEDVITYNNAVAQVAEELASTLQDPTVIQWCTGLGKLHRFHENRHRRLLKRVLEMDALAGDTTDEADVARWTKAEDELSADEIARLEALSENAQALAALDEEEKEETPDPAQPVDASPDPTMAAEPAPAGVGTPDVDAQIESLHGPGAVEAVEAAFSDNDLTDEEKFAAAQRDAEAAAASKENLNG